MGMDSKRATGWESCFLRALLAKLGFQAPHEEAEHRGKQAVLVPQHHAGAGSIPDVTVVRESSCGAVQHTGWASPHSPLQNVPATFSLRNIMCQEFWGFFFLDPKISGFEAFGNFSLHFVIKSAFRKRG